MTASSASRFKFIPHRHLLFGSVKRIARDPFGAWDSIQGWLEEFAAALSKDTRILLLIDEFQKWLSLLDAEDRTRILTGLRGLFNRPATGKLSISIVLSKQKWPRLIASERRYDLGLDAHARGGFEPDGRGIGLACSLTPEYEKVADDATKVRKNYPDVQVLVFATPGKVTKYKEKQWAENLSNDFGLDLVVMSREELVTSLLDPSNADVCRSQLGIHPEEKPELQSVFACVREAIGEVIDNWAQRPRLRGRPLVDLDAERIEGERDSPERLSVEDLRASLAQGRRIILEAPAGRGKTTTLVQIAQRTIADGGLAFLVDLPFWIRSGTEILQFIAQAPAFAKRGVNAKVLLELRGTEPFFFLLNGWNEISEGTAESAVHALRELEQNYPSAGIIVATRTHRLRPPLPGAFRAQLLTLRRPQRDQYLVLALGKSANDLAAKLNNTWTLDQLTRTPLILAEVTELFRRGSTIPTTKTGILGAVMRMVEESEEHNAFLQQAPLSGHAREYLSTLSMAMTENGAVEISELDGCAAVNLASVALQKAGQLVEQPEPMTVLNELAKHHILERLDFPETTFRFQHQQFQEFLAARALKRQLLEVVRGQGVELERRFSKQYVNEPRWGESLSMVAEEIAEQCTKSESVEAGAMLIRMALRVDPIFAADLSNASGSVVWAKVRDDVGKRLRAWYAQEDSHHRQCALAAMLATGSDDFKDIVLPLLSDANDQVRLAAYRTGAQVLPANLGPNWRDLVRDWSEAARVNFVAELAHNPWLADSVEKIALADPSPKVRWNAAHMLSWYGFTEKVEGLLKSLDDASLRDVLRTAQPHDIPRSQWPRVVAVYEQMQKEAASPFERLRLLHVLQTFGGTNIVERMKQELDNLGPDQLEPQEVQGQIRRTLDELQKADPKWVSEWSARRVLEKPNRFRAWRGLITQISNQEREALYSRFSTELLDRGEQERGVSVLVSVMDSALAARVFARACEIRVGLTFPPGHDQAKWNLLRQVTDLLRVINPAILLEGISEKLEKEPDVVELDILTDTLPAMSLTKPDARSAISEELRLKLRTYLKCAAKLGAEPDGLRANTRAHLALLLANVGEREDLEDIRRLIEADSERFVKAQAARMRGEHSHDTTGYGFLYLDAVTMVDPTKADGVVGDLIRSEQYELVLSQRLPLLARKNKGQSDLGTNRMDFTKIWKSRAGESDESFVEERRSRFANAVRGKIERIKAEREAATDKRGFDHRLKMLGGALAALDGKGSTKLILELMGLPGQWDGSTRVGAIESLLAWGVRLSLEEVLRILVPVLQHIKASGLYNDNQNAWLFARCLSVMAFVEPPAAGIAKIRALISELRFRAYELSGVVAALGSSRCDDAIDVLMEFAGSDGKGVEAVRESWIEAIGALEGPRSREILLSFVDPNAKLFNREFIPDHRHGDLVARLLAERAEKDTVLKGKLVELANGDLTPTKRILLAKVFAQFAEEDDRVQGLGVLRDDGSGVPYELVRSMENAFLEHRPFGTSGGSYTLSPLGCNAVRKRLFEMVISDPHRKESAFALLGQIEVWRLEHGHPADELRHPAIESEVSWPPLLS